MSLSGSQVLATHAPASVQSLIDYSLVRAGQTLKHGPPNQGGEKVSHGPKQVHVFDFRDHGPFNSISVVGCHCLLVANA